MVIESPDLIEAKINEGFELHRMRRDFDQLAALVFLLYDWIIQSYEYYAMLHLNAFASDLTAEILFNLESKLTDEWKVLTTL